MFECYKQPKSHHTHASANQFSQDLKPGYSEEKEF